MLKNLFVTILVTVFFATVPVGVYMLTYSQTSTTEATKLDYFLPYPGILPDNPLYVFKDFRDQILKFITRDQSKKAEIYLNLADKKANTAINLEKKGKDKLASKMILLAEKDAQKIKKLVDSAKKQGDGPNQELVSKMKLSNQKHREVIDSLMKEIPKEESDNLTEALKLNEQIAKELKGIK